MVCVDGFLCVRGIVAAASLYHRVTSTTNGKTSSVIIIFLFGEHTTHIYLHLSAAHHFNLLLRYASADIFPRTDYTEWRKG